MNQKAGFYAFLFADVVKSTSLSRALASLGLEEKTQEDVHQIFKEEVSARGGRDWSTEYWDAFHAVFESSRNALASACAIAQRLQDYWSRELQGKGVLPLRLQYGISYGEAKKNPEPPGRPGGEDYGGPAVVVATRLVKLARPSRILLSHDAYETLSSSSPPSTLKPLKPRVRYLDKYLLQGLGWQKVYIYTDKTLGLNDKPPLWGLRHRFQLTISSLALFLLLASGSYWWYYGAFHPDDAKISGQSVILRDGLRTRTILLPTIVSDFLAREGGVKERSFTVFSPVPRTPEQFTSDDRPNFDALNPRHIALADLNGDGVQEAIVLTESQDLITNGLLLAMESDGTFLWEPPNFKEPVRVNEEDEKENFSGLKVMTGDLDLDGKPEIVAMLNVNGNVHSLIAIISADGRILQRYYHYGGLNDFLLFDVNQDRKPDVVFCGINNSRINERWEPVPAGADIRQRMSYRYYGVVAGAFSLGDFTLASSTQPGYRFFQNGEEIPQDYGIFYARFPLSDWTLYAQSGRGYFNQCNLIRQPSQNSLEFIVQEQGDLRDLPEPWDYFSVSYLMSVDNGRISFAPGRIHDVKKGIIVSAYEAGKIPRPLEKMERALTPVLLRPVF